MLNKVILMGRLTADPDIRQTPSGVSVVTFSMAVDRDYTRGEEKQTDFINIVAWRQLAEFISKYFSKGRMIAIEGRIQTRNYVDNNGQKRYVTEVVADKAHFTGESKSANNDSSFTNGPQHPAYTQEATGGSSVSIGDLGDFEEIQDEDDLPF